MHTVHCIGRDGCFARRTEDEMDGFMISLFFPYAPRDHCPDLSLLLVVPGLCFRPLKQ